jgi:tRNA dimethylallyltransferase
MAPEPDNAPLVVIVGETASGKSSLAEYVAERFNGEVVAADSWTVYRDFSIGTAKPDKSMLMRIPHHLIDIADPRDGFNAAEYKRLALAAITDITARGKLPILVGGTGLYIDSVLFDYSFLPPSSDEVRASLNQLSIDELLSIISEAGIDLGGIDVRNKRRLIRLIETDGTRPGRANDLRPNTLVIGLLVPRDELRARVEKRVDMMLKAGLVDEVAALAKTYGWGVEPMKGIGYREFHDYFNGSQSIEVTRDRIVSASMNLAKRQRTWFRRNKSIHWISKRAEAVDLITTFLNN